MKRLLFFILLTLVLRSPQASNGSAYGQNTFQQQFPETEATVGNERFSEGEDEIFSSTYERELLSRRIFKKSLPPLSQKEIVSWSFKTAKANPLL